MRPPQQPLFLARRTYRRRRLIDAIRLVPVLGALLFLIPVLNLSEGGATTLWGGVFLFLSWLGLILLTALLTRRVRRSETDPDDDDGTSDRAADRDAP